MTPTIDDLIADLESRGLGWSIGSTGDGISGGSVIFGGKIISNYMTMESRPAAAMLDIDWTLYPRRESNDQPRNH